MKHLSSEDLQYLCDLSERVGEPLSAGDADLLLAHLEWLLETNTKINLTAITDPKSAIRLHAVDSIAAAPEVRRAPAGSLLDIGTGGGFPGFPLCVVAERSGVLLDSVAKKARVLQEFLDSVGSESRAIPARAEEHAKQNPHAYSIVVARAVAPLPSLIELARPLLASGGRLVCLKGQPETAELQSGKKAAEVCGMKLHSDRSYVLPDGDEQRRILTFEVIGKPRVSLPRGVGKAQHQPLA